MTEVQRPKRTFAYLTGPPTVPQAGRPLPGPAPHSTEPRTCCSQGPNMPPCPPAHPTWCLSPAGAHRTGPIFPNTTPSALLWGYPTLQGGKGSSDCPPSFLMHTEKQLPPLLSPQVSLPSHAQGTSEDGKPA